jgi:hypothetical protein
MTTPAILVIALLAALSGCGEKKSDSAAAWNQKAAAVAKDSPSEAAPAGMAAGGNLGGEVAETFNSGGYTYVRLKTPGGELWAAGPEGQIQVGQKLELVGAMAMQNFHSASLNRDFAEIWFAASFAAPGQSLPADMETEIKKAHGGVAVGKSDGDFSGLTTPSGGLKVAEVNTRRTELAGKTVRVRGKVVKSLTGIMGRNWLHVQDGSGDGETADLTVTSGTSAKVGDTVLIEGVLSVDKDFGSGYFYKAIVEDATVRVEQSS